MWILHNNILEDHGRAAVILRLPILHVWEDFRSKNSIITVSHDQKQASDVEAT